MRPAWRLAISSLSGRRSRAALLAAAVSLATALVIAVASAMATVRGAIESEVGATLGRADFAIDSGRGTLPDALVAEVRRWPGVSAAEGRIQGALSLAVTRDALAPDSEGVYRRRSDRSIASALGNAVSAEGGVVVPPPRMLAGRLPRDDGEIVVDVLLVERLSLEPQDDAPVGGVQLLRERRGVERVERLAVPEETRDAALAAAVNRGQGLRIGDRIEVARQVVADPSGRLDGALRLLRLRRPREFTIVGIADQPPLGGRAQVYLPVGAMRDVLGIGEAYSRIDVRVAAGVDPERVVAAHRDGLPEGAIMQTTARITSGLDRNVRSSQLGIVLATVMASLLAAFIILTGMTTSLGERQRELAIVRCLGGTRAQIAWSQVIEGVCVGALGGAAGVPLGIGLVGLLWLGFRDRLSASLVIEPSAIVLAVVGSIAAGVVGASYPAWRASRVAPLAAMRSRAQAASARGVRLVTLAGLLGLLVQATVVGLPRDGQAVFWGYATVGLPLMFIGYFLLGVPAILIVTRLLARPLSRAVGLPPALLSRSIASTPYRHGLTAGALMGGLALMVAIWTNGGAILRDWLDKIQFPDAFVSGIALTPEARDRLAALPVVADSCAVSILPVETDAFGVRALQRYKTSFIAFEPEPFFRLNRLTWVQGDPREAARRLDEGGAVIVAREFLVAQGMGVGSTFRAGHAGEVHEFEIVGVVASPGLEVVSKFFNVGDDYIQQSVHAVFGSRRDMRERFGSDSIQLIQIGLAEGVGDAAALRQIREALHGYGVLDAGSGRQLKRQIRTFATGMLLVFSTVAVGAMVVACFGVANLIVASIDARRFQFGVLRALGAARGTLARLVLAEAVLVGVAAAILGTCMGLQGSWAGQRLYGFLLGLSLELRPPIGAIAIAWACMLLLATGAAVPSVMRLARRRTTELLAPGGS